MMKILAALALTLTLTACQQEASVEKPLPVAMTAEATGHYCQMTVLEHDGPKAQIHLAGNPFPLWFTQVRDAVAFTRSPEEPKDYVAVYVSDMGKAEDWAKPGADNWIDADAAWFVISSRQSGGMGAPEAIPFGVEDQARAFAASNGGEVVRLADIPSQYVLDSVLSAADGSDDATIHLAETHHD